MANVSSSNGLEKRPKLRFPGFDEPWKKCEFKEFAKVNPKCQSIPEQFYYIDLGSVEDGELSNAKIENALSAPSRAQRLLSCNDVLFQTVRPYQQNNYLFCKERSLPTVASTGYAVFRTKYDVPFLYALIHTGHFLNSVLSRCTGTSFPAVSASDIEDILVSIPSLGEQQKIGELFRLLNSKIRKQKALIESLKKYKRGVTEAIFTKDLRFTTKGVPYPQWDKKYVGDICKIQTGKSNTQDETSQGSYPFYVRSPIVRKSNRYLFDCEAVLTVGDGVGTGKVFHYVTGKFDLHQRVYAMTDFKIVSGKYFYYYFSHFFYDRVMRMTAKTSVDSVRYEMIDKMAIQIPCHEEQQQIVCFLDCLEHSVTEAEKTLNLLEKLKSGCLQQLFI